MVRPFVPWGLSSSTPSISSDTVDVGCPVSLDDIVLVETPSLLVKDPWSARNLFLLVVRGFYFHYWWIFKTFSSRRKSVSTKEVVEKIKKKLYRLQEVIRIFFEFWNRIKMNVTTAMRSKRKWLNEWMNEILLTNTDEVDTWVETNSERLCLQREQGSSQL